MLSHRGLIAVYPPFQLAPMPPFTLPMSPRLFQEPLFAVPTRSGVAAQFSSPSPLDEFDYFLCYDGKRLHAIQGGGGPVLPSASRSLELELQGESIAFGRRSAVQICSGPGNWQIRVVRCHLRGWSWCGTGLASEAELVKEDFVISKGAMGVLPFFPHSHRWLYDEFSGRLVFSTPTNPIGGTAVVDLPGPV